MRYFSTTILFLRLLQLAANKLVQALRDHPVYQLRIIGYADSRGNEEFNQAPSERRAEAVKRYFIDWKVDPSCVITEGRGETEPAAPNPTPVGMSYNRRVEFQYEFMPAPTLLP